MPGDGHRSRRARRLAGLGTGAGDAGDGRRGGATRDHRRGRQHLVPEGTGMARPGQPARAPGPALGAPGPVRLRGRGLHPHRVSGDAHRRRAAGVRRRRGLHVRPVDRADGREPDHPQQVPTVQCVLDEFGGAADRGRPLGSVGGDPGLPPGPEFRVREHVLRAPGRAPPARAGLDGTVAGAVGRTWLRRRLRADPGGGGVHGDGPGIGPARVTGLPPERPRRPGDGTAQRARPGPGPGHLLRSPLCRRRGGPGRCGGVPRGARPPGRCRPAPPGGRTARSGRPLRGADRARRRRRGGGRGGDVRAAGGDRRRPGRRAGRGDRPGPVPGGGHRGVDAGPRRTGVGSRRRRPAARPPPSGVAQRPAGAWS